MTLKDNITFLKKKMANADQDWKQYKSILDKLLKLSEADQPDPMHNAMVGIYKEFLASFGFPFIMDGRQGKALKSIIKKLRAVENIGDDDEKLIIAWKFLFANWDRVGTFISKQKELDKIDRNLLEIMDNIRNGNDKKSQAKTATEHLRSKYSKR